MTQLHVQPTSSLTGSVSPPGDKSISHRAILLGSLAEGKSIIDGFLPGGDCLATLSCMQQLGTEITTLSAEKLEIEGKGLTGLRPSFDPLDCVRSGTTMRLLAGILAGQYFNTILSGDPQLLRRPMERVAVPLRKMGAQIETTDGHAPISIQGAPLHGADHKLMIASAQIKSALLLAGLYAQGPTTIHSPGPSRDHTERMLAGMGAQINEEALTVSVTPGKKLSPFLLRIPGDFSSAAFIIAAGLLVPTSEILIKNVGVNPTRTGLLEVLKGMGADIQVENEHLEGNEPVADLLVRSSRLSGIDISGDTVVRMIDEFSLLAVLATQADGITTVRDAAELRVKETDRIATVAAELQKLGARIQPHPDGFTVEGPVQLKGGAVNSHGDHRLAMALAVAGLATEDDLLIENAECISDSFPGFIPSMQSIGAKYA